ncbi:hypothetical protein BGZ80_003838 [Entomortierella chlamydospora]|uniref:Zn(2)-C6 fungal-type domain-containing protein n=1 Tax=Entomortierella chlamydospora TaxID=101097 RepID=A0A9P6SWP5_9FUNG|nr:hypothetical protein BGZ80_003838 [Entomortierella chlamydospora]
MATSTLQLLPTTNDIEKLDPSTISNIPGSVAYDLKRLKVYSSCLRCRAKKVKCDRKEPCSRCEKHSVECSYRELASVQLDIRQFQRHLNNPKIRKDGAGILTDTATPVIPTASTTTTTSASPPPSSSEISATASSLARGGSSKNDHTSLPKPSPHNNYECPNPIACGSLAFESNPTISAAGHVRSTADDMEGVRVYKVHRRRYSLKTSKVDHAEDSSRIDNMNVDMTNISEHVDRVRLSDHVADRSMSPNVEEEEDSDNVPIWCAQAVGKHKQTAHEQDMAETFGLAAYLKAKEMEISKDPSRAGETIDFEMELERALTRRMPSSFSRPDRLYSRARKHGQPGHSSATPYARPSHCQLSPYAGKDGHTTSKSHHAQPPPTAQCCCQIAAQQGRALDSCPYSNVSHAGYEKHSTQSLSPSISSPRTTNRDSCDPPRIAYSPSYSPRYSHREVASASPPYSAPHIKTNNWQTTSAPYLSILPPLPSPSTSSGYSSSSRMDVVSPTTELPPIRLSRSSELSALQVGRDGDEPMQIGCKYNEPNVDAWDMIEKPISRKIPLTTKRGRSIKMEMGWILS